MSGFSNSLVDDISFLYSNISQKNTEILNEDSQYYDEEVAELVEDILSKISLSMIYEGYSANATISFLANSSEDDILNEYLNFNENLIKESVVSEDYIQEQIEIFDFAISEAWQDKLLGGAVKIAARIASKPARMKVAQKMMTSNDPAKTAAAVDRLARMKMNKAGFPADMTKKLVDAAPNISGKTTIVATSPAIGKVVKGVQKVKEIAKSAKAALTSPIAKKVGLGALGLGAAVGTGYIGGKMSNDGSAKVGPKIVGPKIVGPKIVGPKIVGPKSSSSSGDGGGGSNSSSGSENSTSQNKTPKKKESTPSTKPPYMGTTPGGTKFERRTPTSKELEAAQEKRTSGGSEEEAIKAGVDAGKTSNPVKMDIPGFALGGKMPEFGVDKTGIKPPTTFTKSTTPEKKKTSTETTSEGYDAYDLVLEYLLSQGHTETIEEAHYVMMEMDEEMIGSIVEQYITESKKYEKSVLKDIPTDLHPTIKKAIRSKSSSPTTARQRKISDKTANLRYSNAESDQSTGTNRGPESPTDR